MPSVAGILLAAGGGSRLGRPKALVEIGGQTLAARGAGLLRAGGADPIIVVTGSAPVDLPDVTLVPNPDWRTGMGSSLVAGLTAVRDLPPDGPDGADGCDAAVIALADQPLIGAEAVRRLIAAHAAGATVAVAAYDGRARNPVLIGREHWDEVLATTAGDAGARPFLRAHPGLVTVVDCTGTGRPDDIDTPADLARLIDLAGKPARGLQLVLAEPGQAGLGHRRPAGVDDQRVSAVELLQVGGGYRVPVLLEGGLGDGLGHGARSWVPMVSSSGPRSGFLVLTASGECRVKFAVAASNSGLAGDGTAHCWCSWSDSSGLTALPKL
jgi:CTP:molybdopterin cytidylyltransferase MocA